MKRRSFLLLATLASGGLLAGCGNPARQQPRGGALPLRDGQVALNGWVKLDPEGVVSVVIARSEMGQGVHTALQMLVAEELDCAWDQMRLEEAPIDGLYGNVTALSEGVPFRPDDQSVLARSMRWTMKNTMGQLGFMVTGGSTSVRDLWLPMRHAAAATRATLVSAVAQEWRVSADEVAVVDGIFSGPRDRRMTLGESVRLLGAQPKVTETVTLKSPAKFKVLGQPRLRTEAASKVAGSAQFGIDVRPEGLLFAAVRFAPTRGGNVRSFDDSKVRGRPGVKGVVPLEPLHGGTGGVVVVADRWWRAHQALESLAIEFDDGPLAGKATADLTKSLGEALASEAGFTYWKRGDAGAVIATSPRKLDAEYSAPYLAHATMEPMNCTVLLDGSRATVWAPTQVPTFARKAAAKALGIDADQVDLKVTYLGGGFGRRLEVDVIAQAATIARRFPGQPVQLIWTREDDTRHDFYRPAALAHFRAALDSQGRLAAWQHTSASQAIAPQYMPRATGMPFVGPDKTTAEGAFDVAYEFPAVHMAHVALDLPVPIGYWRAVGHSHQAFFVESFMDECAHAAGQDPVDFRRALLAQHPRQRAVLDLAVEKAGWNTPVGNAPDGARLARGVALHESFGAVVAQVVEVSMGADRAIRVHRVVCAIDCGFVVNPNLVAQQLESAVVFGLTAALHGRIDLEHGRVTQGNFHEYLPLRLPACPVIETHLVNSEEPPEGVGEPGLPPVAPAVANAVFALTGQRLRSLPLALPSTLPA